MVCSSSDLNCYRKNTYAGIALPVAAVNDNCYAKPMFLRITREEVKQPANAPHAYKDTPTTSQGMLIIDKRNRNKLTYICQQLSSTSKVRPKSSYYSNKKTVREVHSISESKACSGQAYQMTPSMNYLKNRMKKAKYGNISNLVTTHKNIMNRKVDSIFAISNKHKQVTNCSMDIGPAYFHNISPLREKSISYMPEKKIKINCEQYTSKANNKFMQIKEALLKKIKDVEEEEKVYCSQEKCTLAKQ